LNTNIEVDHIMENALEYLKGVEPFHQFPKKTLKQVVDLAHPHAYAAGEFVTHHDDEWPYMVYIKEGALEAVKESPEGRSLLVYKLHAGDVFWGLTFFNERVRMPVSLRAAEETHLLVWSRQEILPLLLEHGHVLWSICTILIQRVQVASAIVENLAFQPVANRMAKMLIDTYGGRGSEPLSRDMTLDEMAARVGTTREMVCRVLYKFSDNQWIDITRTEFRLVDPQALVQLAGTQISDEA
jgi:CRP-like cAMP-binding protein